MTISLIFIFLLLVENLFLPALIGPKTFLISPLFLIGAVVYGENTKSRLFQVLLLLLFWEIFSGFKIGHLIVPFGLMILFYIWMNQFLNMGSGLKESGIIAGGVGGILVLAALLYLYSLILLFFQSSYDIFSAFAELKILVYSSAFQTLAWSACFVIMFRYAIRPK